jgi:hypothetical protein
MTDFWAGLKWLKCAVFLAHTGHLVEGVFGEEVRDAVFWLLAESGYFESGETTTTTRNP